MIKIFNTINEMARYIEAGSLGKNNLLFDEGTAERAEYYVFQSDSRNGTPFPAYEIIDLLSALIKGKQDSRPLITGVLNEPITRRKRLTEKSAFLTHVDSNTEVGDPPLDFRYESPISYLLGGAVEEVVYANAKEPYVFSKMPNGQDNTIPVWVKTIIVKDITFQYNEYKTTPVFDVHFITDQVRMGTLFQLPRWLSDFELDNPRPHFIRATPITYLDQDNMIRTLTRSTYLEAHSRDMYKQIIAKGALSKKEFDVIADFFRNYLMEILEIVANPLIKEEEAIDILQQPLTGHIYSQLRINMAIEDMAPLVKQELGVVGTPTLVKSDDEIKTTDKGDIINIMEKSDNKNELPCANCINEMLKNHDLGLSDEQRLAVVGLMAMALNMKPEKED